MSNCNNSSCSCKPKNNVCGCKTSSDEVVYTGATLPCTGIENCTPLTEAIATISEYLCSTELVQTIINTIINNETLYSQFTTIVNNTVECETVWNCATTTTTTTIEPTTTTTTTTICDCYFYDVNVTSGDIAAADDGIVYASFSNCNNDGVIKEYTVEGVYDDDFCANVDLITPDLYYYVESVLTLAENRPTQAGLCCNTTTTTTTII